MSEINSTILANNNKNILHIPEEIRYNCQGCGRCCTNWAIGLTEQDYNKIKDIDWQSKHPSLADKELFVHREKEFASGQSSSPHFTKARPDGTCPFLIDNMCFIHATYGEELKPTVCKHFPYTFVDTPDGTYTGLIYSSMAAVRNVGELLTDQRTALESLWQLTKQQTCEVGSQVAVKLTSTISISWQEYLFIEKLLLKLLSSENDLFEIWFAGEEIILQAAKLKETGENLEGISIAKNQKSKWLSSQPSYSEWLLFRGLLFKNFVWPEFSKQHSLFWFDSNKNPFSHPKVISAAIKTVFSKTIELNKIGKIDIAKCFNAPFEPFSKEVEQFFKRYIYLRLFSKTYFGPALGEIAILSGFNNLMSHFVCSIIYAKACAIKKDKNCIELADLFEAYFLLDTELTAIRQIGSNSMDAARFYDLAFSSPRLFNRLLGALSKSIATE